MLSLEQVGAINAALQRGDLHAALLPLEDQIDLRHADLPRLEKSAKIALQHSFNSPEGARFWAKALFHPNVSVRRFVRRAVLGASDAAALLFEPLAEEIEAKWERQTPRPDDGNKRALEQWLEAEAALGGAIEMLLRCDPEEFVALWGRKIDEGTPTRREQAALYRAHNESQNRQSEAYRAEVERLSRERLGENFESAGVPFAITLQIHEDAQKAPAVIALQNEVGEWDWNRVSPPEEQLKDAAWTLRYGSTAKGKALDERVQASVRAWIFAAFDTGDELARERCKSLDYSLGAYFDDKTLAERGVAWLEREVARGRSGWDEATWALSGAISHLIARPWNPPRRLDAPRFRLRAVARAR